MNFFSVNKIEVRVNLLKILDSSLRHKKSISDLERLSNLYMKFESRFLSTHCQFLLSKCIIVKYIKRQWSGSDTIEFHTLPRIPNWERGTYNTALQIKTTQSNSQGDSSFPADSLKIILNKMNKNTSKTNKKWTDSDNYIKTQQKHRLGTVSNKLLGSLNRFYARASLALGSVVIHMHTSYSVRMKD